MPKIDEIKVPVRIVSAPENETALLTAYVMALNATLAELRADSLLKSTEETIRARMAARIEVYAEIARVTAAPTNSFAVDTKSNNTPLAPVIDPVGPVDDAAVEREIGGAHSGL